MIPSRASLLGLLVAALAAVAPLPHGGVGAAAETTLRLASFALLALAAFTLERPGELRRLRLPLLAMGGLALLGLGQSAALPRGFARAISPEHLRLHDQAAEALRTGVEPGGVALSLAPAVTRFSAVGWLAAAAILIAAFAAGRRRRHRRWLAVALVAGGLGQVLMGARGALAVTHVRLRGAFVNPDHLALYLEIALAVALAWACRSWMRWRSEGAAPSRAWILAPPLAGWLALLAGLILTGSRAGLVAGLAATLLQVALFGRERKSWRPAVWGLAATALGVGVAALAAGDRRLGRALGTSLWEITWSGRLRVWGLSLDLVESFPWTGTGLGTFLQALPLVQPPEMAGEVWARAHNDPLELLVTGGMVAGALALLGLIAVVGSLWRVLGQGRRSEDRLAGLAALGALAAVGLHELIDFGLTLPANAVALCVVLGAAIGASTRRRET